MSSSSAPESVNVPQRIGSIWNRREPCPFDEVIDVRSPDEFHEDHIPGAINLPVLTNDERVEVGTIYRQEGPFPARKRGAAHVSENIATHLRNHFEVKGKEYRPLIYCWRGGQRSGSLATVLAQVGWRVTVLNGGYKTYRQYVIRELETLPNAFQYRIISGATGSGKSRLLRTLATCGAQVIDLEALARHRGSLLGGGEPQPAQKDFETQLLVEFERLDPAKPVWVEAESKRIGDVFIPQVMWLKMQQATGIEIQLSLEERVKFLIRDYPNMLSDPEMLKQKLRQLSTRLGSRQIDEWCQLIDQTQWHDFVASILQVHYDPSYQSSAKRYYPNVSQAEPLSEVSDAALLKLAQHAIADAGQA